MQSAVARRAASRPAPASRRTSVAVRAASDATPDALARARVPKWEIVSQYLLSKNLRTIPPTEALKLAEREGAEWVVVDVRPPASHARAAPKGSVSVPLYIPLEVNKKDGGGFDLAKGLKALAYALNGVSGVDPNPLFEEQLQQALRDRGAKGALFLCEAGGTLRATPNFPAGKSSRSLQACFRAFRDGLLPEECVAHVSGGAAQWFREGLPFEGEGEYDAAEAGRTPNAAAEPQGVFVDAAKEKMGLK